MREMTLSPAMGEYLDMVRSAYRQNPNENYPRELLQLFSVGLYLLNPDGTYQLDGQGNRIPLYDQARSISSPRSSRDGPSATMPRIPRVQTSRSEQPN